MEDNQWIAASDGDIDRVRAFLSRPGASVNAADENGYTCAHAAASYGHATLLGHLLGARALLAAGADAEAKNGDGATPLDAAASPVAP